jgi:predicted metal-dependent enzyme (double-stranded beta helix superfamily)
MREARAAIEEHGFAEPAISEIKKSLADLAKTDGLRDREDLRGLHGSTKTEAVVLASDGLNDLTLILARFAPNEPTPVHDHGTWAVLHVLEGHDRYIEWKRVDDGTDPGRAQLEIESEQFLQTGDSVHWFGPPHDIHSQVAQDGPAWELIVAGSNMLLLDRHYFDPATGHVTTSQPQIR